MWLDVLWDRKPPLNAISKTLLYIFYHSPTNAHPSSPDPLPASTQRHAPATWQRLFTGGWKALHCFPAIHSSCLKVPAFKGEEDTFLFFLSECICICMNLCVCIWDKTPCAERKKYGGALETLGMQGLQRTMVRQLTFVSCIIGTFWGFWDRYFSHCEKARQERRDKERQQRRWRPSGNKSIIIMI